MVFSNSDKAGQTHQKSFAQSLHPPEKTGGRGSRSRKISVLAKSEPVQRICEPLLKNEKSSKSNSIFG
jgi:hypothetical protein